ncbi:acyltransferase family protein [Robiginitomaculum antarcticum]|uniref:acyltransferase family protein n=1 Tax=Robiginitomaculum antarcticum TaxID=437507 RepID=UPI00035E4D53|nr:acyltransferase [Robiginitomaculum antarcticum]
MTAAGTVKQNEPPRDYYGALDGFRGVLALMVAIYHTIWLSSINSHDLLNNGPVLVDLFFVFSGFLMFRLYRGRLTDRASGAKFIKRRFARIYPLHFFMLMVFVLFQFMRVISHKVGISVVEPGEILPFQAGAAETLPSFLANLTLTQSMGILDSLSYNPPAWTVSVEFWAYFVFLGMMLLAPPSKPRHFAIIALLVGVIYATLSRLKPDMDFHYDLGFWRCLGGFYSGILAAWIYSRLPGKWRGKTGRVKHSGTVLEIAMLIGLYLFVVYCGGKLQFFLAPVAISFVVIFAMGQGGISRFMSTRPLLYLGKISYSIYMVHVVIAIGFGIFAERILPGLAGETWNMTGLGGTILLLPYLAVVIGISHFTYHWIEKRGQTAILNYRLPAWWRSLLSGVRANPAS